MDRAFRKNYIISFFVCTLTVVVLFAGNDEELFLRGNTQYKHKDYDNAFRSYDMMSKKGRAALYNMGNCRFQQGDYAQAFVYWSRAEGGATPQEYSVIARNKEHVLSIIGKQEDQSLSHRIMKILHDVLPYVSLFFLQLFFLLCWYLFIFSARTQQMKTKKIVLSGLCLLIAISGAVLRVHYIKQSIQNGIVIKKEAQLFVGPDKGLHVLTPIVYANTVAVKEIRDGWYKVRYADMIGWVEADVIQII